MTQETGRETVYDRDVPVKQRTSQWLMPQRELPGHRAPRRRSHPRLVEEAPLDSARQSGPSISRPFTHDEVAFFNEGEELATTSAADSFSDLKRR